MKDGMVPLSFYERERDSLARGIREFRIARGLSGRQLARLSGMSQAKISKIETGRVVPSAADAEALGRSLRVPPGVRTEWVEQATTLATEVNSWRAVQRKGFWSKQEEIKALEGAASTTSIFQDRVVPGLLQTAEYARQLLSRIVPPEELAAAVSSRLDRQTTLFDNSKQFWFLIAEAALRHRVCPPATMIAQLDRIASLSTLGNATVGIIPWTSEFTVPPPHSFVMFDTDQVMVETVTAEIIIREPRDIAKYTRVFDQLRGMATFGDAARSMLTSLMTEYGVLQGAR
jgi:transcriptional regulator with XRE-family HTH domain